MKDNLEILNFTKITNTSLLQDNQSSNKVKYLLYNFNNILEITIRFNNRRANKEK